MSNNNEAPENAVVWFEIGVKDLDAAAQFYGDVLQAPLQRQAMGGQDVAVFPHAGGAGGNLYQNGATGGSGPIVHLAAPSPLEDTLARVGAAGGRVVSDIHAIPSGRFAYCQDPDGTRFGLYTPN